MFCPSMATLIHHRPRKIPLWKGQFADELTVKDTKQIFRDGWRLRILIGLAILSGHSLFAQETLELLQTDSQTYSNVVVTSKNRTHVFISHAQGTATLKVKGLSLEAQRQLGYQV